MKRLALTFVLLAGLLAACTTAVAPQRPQIGNFGPNPASIEAGGASILSWTVTGADDLKLNPGNLDVTGVSSTSVSPVATTSYVLTATNAAGSSQATATVTVTTATSTTSRPVRADEGGTLETAGATLTIPAGALNQDTLVSLSVGAAPSEVAENPLQASGPAVAIDLGGARLRRPASLAAPYSAGGDADYVITETGSTAAPGEMLGIRVHAATPAGDGTMTLQIERAASYVVYAIPRLDAPTGRAPMTEGIGNTSLQVPFYWQAGYPWCSPTATAMVLNYFQPLPGLDSSNEAPGGWVSNYYLASLLDQDATSGSWAVSFLEAARVPADRYSWLVWDADLIPSAPFSNYVVLATTGVFGLFPKKPILTTSDQTNHAFVITGLSAEGIYINDSNARWSGTHPALTWTQFRDQNKIGDQNDELGTLLVFAEPRPEAERRGSLELAPPTAEDMSRTIRFRNPSGTVIANWAWDANPFARGYYFQDATKSSYWPSDYEFGYVLPRSSLLDVSFNIVNISEQERDYAAVARLYIGNAFKAERADLSVRVGAYRRGRVDFTFEDLGALVGAIGSPVTGRVELNLSQNGVVQDVKVVSFRLGSDPSDTPTVTIRRPSYGITTLLNVPLTFEGDGYDRYHFPDSRVPAARMSWWEGGTKLGDGATLERAFTGTGLHTLTLRATGEYGTVGSQTVQVNVIDPVRNPGEVVIDYPANGATFAYGDFFDVNLTGHATYADGSAVPGDRLSWSYDDGFGTTQIGVGASQVVRLYGHCTGRSYTLTLTARKADGSPIGTRTITVEVIAPPC